ncbi:MAG: hypothetical protein IJ168_08255 [Eubacterium sp.]|nr:hypothetical protein [Eubacterium sp.]
MQKIETTIELLRDMAETEPREGYKVALENAANLLEGNPTEEMYEQITEVMKDLMPGLIKGITDVVNSLAEILRTKGDEILPYLARALAERALEEVDDEQLE